MGINLNTAIVTRTGGTPEAVSRRINDILGKVMASPRQDQLGEQVVVRDILSIQIMKTGIENYYGVAVIIIGPVAGEIDVEREFFASIDAGELKDE